MMSIEEFDSIEEDHEFSDIYRKKKKRIIKKYEINKSKKVKAGKIAASVAGLCIISTVSVYAAPKLYNMYFSDKGKVSTSVNVDADNEYKDDVEKIISGEITEVPEIKLTFNYLPDGFVNNGKDEYTYSDETNQERGIYITPLLYDSEEEWNTNYVTEKEVLTISGHTAFLVKHQYTSDTERNNIDIAILYPEYNRIILYEAWGYISEDEVLKVAENTIITKTGNNISVDSIFGKWSEYLKKCNENTNENTDVLTETVPIDEKKVISDEKMINLHKINEDVKIIKYGIVSENLFAKVTKVQVLDDVSCLEYIPEYWQPFINDDKSIAGADLKYIKYGDGIDSLSNPVKSENKNLKLVYVTTEYTNKGNTSIYDFLYYATILNLKHGDDKWYINQCYFDKSKDKDVEYDETRFDSLSLGFGETRYFYPSYDGMDTNTIPELKPGEIYEVNYAWLIPEDQLDAMYLSFGSVYYEFQETDLEMGYVDLNAGE